MSDLSAIHSAIPVEADFARLDAEYNSLATCLRHMAEGKMRSLIVNGPPGVGKSSMVKQFLTQYSTDDHKVVSGHITNLSMYHALFTHRAAKQVLVLDDTDNVFSKIEGLNILKAAMDTQPVRTVSWESPSAALTTMGVPLNFQTNGGVVLITNVGFSDSNSKLGTHLKALKDRSHVVQIGSNSKEGAYSMIAYMVLRKDMLKAYELSDAIKHALLTFIHENLDRMTTLSLRTMIKLAEWYKNEPDDWRSYASTTLMKAA